MMTISSSFPFVVLGIQISLCIFCRYEEEEDHYKNQHFMHGPNISRQIINIVSLIFISLNQKLCLPYPHWYIGTFIVLLWIDSICLGCSLLGLLCGHRMREESHDTDFEFVTKHDRQDHLIDHDYGHSGGYDQYH